MLLRTVIYLMNHFILGLNDGVGNEGVEFGLMFKRHAPNSAFTSSSNFCKLQLPTWLLLPPWISSDCTSCVQSTATTNVLAGACKLLNALLFTCLHHSRLLRTSRSKSAFTTSFSFLKHQRCLLLPACTGSACTASACLHTG